MRWLLTRAAAYPRLRPASRSERVQIRDKGPVAWLGGQRPEEEALRQVLRPAVGIAGSGVGVVVRDGLGRGDPLADDGAQDVRYVPLEEPQYSLDKPSGELGRPAAVADVDLGCCARDWSWALADDDLERTERALQRARAVDEPVRSLREEVDVGRWTARHAPPRRRALGHLELCAAGVSQIELAALNVGQVARAARNLMERSMVPPRPLLEATYELARAMEALRHPRGPRMHAGTR
jgi:hypothetical protein